MSKAKRNEFPGTVILYICDYDGVAPIFAVTTDAQDIPAEEAGSIVATYRIEKTHIFDVTKELR